MSYSDKVENFLEAPPNELDSLNMADLELIVGDVMERVRSRSNSPLGSRDVSPNRLHSNASTSPSELSSCAEESDHSDEEYIDSVEIPEPRKPLENGIIHPDRIVNGYGFKENPSTRMKSKSASRFNVDISQEITEAINKLRLDVEHLSHRVNELENSKSDMKEASLKKHHSAFFNGMSSQLIGFLIVWPFLVSLITYRYIHKK